MLKSINHRSYLLKSSSSSQRKNVPFTENDCSRSQLVGIAAHRPAQLGSRTNSKQTPVCTYQSKLYVPFADAVKTCCRHTAKSDLALARNVRLSLSRHLLCKLYEVDIAELQSEFDFFSLCACFTSHPDFIYTVTHKSGRQEETAELPPGRAGRAARPRTSGGSGSAPSASLRSRPTRHCPRPRPNPPSPRRPGRGPKPLWERPAAGRPPRSAARHGTAPAGREEVVAKSRCGGRGTRGTPCQPRRPPAVSPTRAYLQPLRGRLPHDAGRREALPSGRRARLCRPAPLRAPPAAPPTLLPRVATAGAGATRGAEQQRRRGRWSGARVAGSRERARSSGGLLRSPAVSCGVSLETARCPTREWPCWEVQPLGPSSGNDRLNWGDFM